MKYQQCEWCEAKARRRYTAKDRKDYVRYSCESDEHRRMIVGQLELDGVKSVKAEWIEKDSQNKELVQPDPLGQTE